MRRREASQKRGQKPETEEDRREQEEETVKDSKMEEQAGDNEEARGGLDLQKLWELIKEDSKT